VLEVQSKLSVPGYMFGGFSSDKREDCVPINCENQSKKSPSFVNHVIKLNTDTGHVYIK